MPSVYPVGAPRLDITTIQLLWTVGAIALNHDVTCYFNMSIDLSDCLD
ncbi:hypothetical protein [Chamaesiphon sp. OTE_20_metabat_361]|nr:hypothetical protein [Chamaesiphon sp. OTE_20_metabat_361]